MRTPGSSFGPAEAQTGNGAPVPLGKLGIGAALDPAGRWLATLTDDVVRVVRIADGSIAAQLDLGPRNGLSVRLDRKSTRLNSSHSELSRMPSSA